MNPITSTVDFQFGAWYRWVHGVPRRRLTAPPDPSTWRCDVLAPARLPAPTGARVAGVPPWQGGRLLKRGDA